MSNFGRSAGNADKVLNSGVFILGIDGEKRSRSKRNQLLFSTANAPAELGVVLVRGGVCVCVGVRGGGGRGAQMEFHLLSAWYAK